MAPKAAMKRPASTGLAPRLSLRPAARPGRPAKVARVEDAVPGQCDALQPVLLGATELPEDVRQMLANVALTSLGVARDERHAYQEKVAEWIGEAVRSAEAGLQANISATDDAVAAAKAAAEEKDAQKAALDAKLQELKSEALQKKEALAAQQAVFDGAVEALKAAEAAKGSADKAVAALSERREAVEGCKKVFGELRGGAVEASEVPGRAAEVCAQARALALNASLLDSLPAALQSEPEKRGEFTDLVMANFEAELDKALGELNGKIEAAQSECTARAAAVVSAQGDHDAGKEQLEACRDAQKEANKAVADGRQAGKDAATTAAATGPAVVKAEAALQAAKSKLEKFQAGPLATYTQLFERIAAPPPAPEPLPEAADAVMEAEAEAPAAALKAADPVAAAAEPSATEAPPEGAATKSAAPAP